MRTTFRDSILQKEFERRGYILLPQLLDAGDVKALKELFISFQGKCTGPFHTSHFSSDLVYKKKVHDTMSAIVYPRVAPYLERYIPLFGNLMVKNPEPNVAMDLHADWAYVDEAQSRSVAIWAPLIDTTPDNGRFGIIEGSHHITNKVRGPLILQSTRDHEPQWERQYGKLLPMRAGDVIIYDHALLHYSPPNKSNTPRPAINLTLAPEEGPWLHYCQPEGANEIEVYEVTDPEFFMRYDHFRRPEMGTLSGKITPSTSTYIEGRMNAFWKRRLWDKITHLF